VSAYWIDQSINDSTINWLIYSTQVEDFY